MEDYPGNLSELEARFSTEEACRDYLFEMRWPKGFRCPRCAGAGAWPLTRLVYECVSCGHQASVIAGTIFHRTHQPLTLWFRAIWLVTSQKTGVSALGLQRALGLGSYKTAWMWLHKLRRAMVRQGRDRLSGRVEVDETYWGASETGGVHGRKLHNKTVIVVAAQVDGMRIGRIRMRRIPSASPRFLEDFVTSAVEPGSVVHTDGWHGYNKLPKKGYVHEVSNLAKSKKTATELLERVHRVIMLLKTWMRGTHQGAVSHEHLDYYLDEFTFRFNRRTSRSRGKLFYRLVQQAMQLAPIPYEAMIKHARGQESGIHKI